MVAVHGGGAGDLVRPRDRNIAAGNATRLPDVARVNAVGEVYTAMGRAMSPSEWDKAVAELRGDRRITVQATTWGRADRFLRAVRKRLVELRDPDPQGRIDRQVDYRIGKPAL